MKNLSALFDSSRRASVRRLALPALLLTASAVACAQNGAVNPRDNWGTVPLGPNVAPQNFDTAPVKRPLQSNFKANRATGAKVVLVRDGVPQAVILTAAKPTAAARDAARQLSAVLQQISKAQLVIATEDHLKVQQNGGARSTLIDGKPVSFLLVVGETEFGRAAGVTAADLPNEGYRLKTKGNALFVVGRDTGTGGIPALGTHHAAFALLERRLGCRWLWPGADGAVLPQRSTVEVLPLDESDAPAIGIRTMRDLYANKNNTVSPRVQEGLRRIGQSDEEYLAKSANSGDWIETQQLGRSLLVGYGHAYNGWWDKYGAEHPDWFALQPNGSRKQIATREKIDTRERLDVSNPEVVQAAAQQAIEFLKARPEYQAASVSPNDGGPNAFCMCEVCRRLDPPNAPKVSLHFTVDGKGQDIEYPSLSDRYATFYANVANIVAKAMPDRWIGAYAYSAYRTPPLYAKLPPNVMIGFVGLGYFDDQDLKRDRESWNGWARAANNILLRPNLLLQGHGFPAVYAHKIDADLKHAYQTGMIGGDFDSIQHNWATQGLNYYVLAHLLWDPSQNVDALIKDYCDTGFGAASPSIQKYFARLEQITNQIAAHSTKVSEGELRDEEADQPKTYYTFLQLIPKYYTPQALAELNGVLDEAAKAAGTDEAVKRRVEFLRAGLRYAEVQSQLFALRWEKMTPELKTQVLNLLQKRQSTYNEIFKNDFYAVNVAYLTWREQGLFDDFGWHPEKKK